MPSRTDIKEVVTKWAMLTGEAISDDMLRQLVRVLHITMNESAGPRTDDAIANEVERWKFMLKRLNDPVAVGNAYLDQSKDIPYHAQKVLQWIIAEAYSAGLKKGRL